MENQQSVLLEDFFRKIIFHWTETPRWRGKPHVTPENDLVHSLKTVFQTVIALSIEEGENKSVDLDMFKILVCALIHDAGEACQGCDITFDIKKAPKYGGVWEEIEEQLFKERFREVFEDDLFKFLCQCYNIRRESSRNGRFFHAIEEYGYSAFAAEEMFLTSKNNENVIQFHQVILRSSEELEESSNEFKSISVLSAPILPIVRTGTQPQGWLLEPTLKDIINSLVKTHAWTGFHFIHTGENLLERIFKIALLAVVAIFYETKFNKRKKFNAYKVLAAACLHKSDKFKLTVLSQDIKQKPLFRKISKVWQADQYEKISAKMSSFPEVVQNTFLKIFRLKHDRQSFEGRFFDAIKNLSHVMYAYYEYVNYRYPEYVSVFKNCHPLLEKYSSEFKSIEKLYSPLREEIKKIIKENK